MERPQRTAVLVKRLQQAGLAARCWKLPSRQVRYTLARCTPAACMLHERYILQGPCVEVPEGWQLCGGCDSRRVLNLLRKMVSPRVSLHPNMLCASAGDGCGAAPRAHGGAHKVREHAAAHGRLAAGRQLLLAGDPARMPARRRLHRAGVACLRQQGAVPGHTCMARVAPERRMHAEGLVI